ncbi:hypothetical protein M3Y99_01691900 [Aphelenchoides fujianensis]|nr:hypothetical protein M3Y99_01691900 [Aphelenchoides fujianensis]
MNRELEATHSKLGGNLRMAAERRNSTRADVCRWRNDEELAQFAWNQKPLDLHVNMMIAQQPPIIHGTTATNGTPAAAHPAMANGQPADPSLIDYEAIDVYWRHDIEMEKGVPLDVHPIHYANGQGCSSSSADVSNEQFERDLQL